MKNKNKNKTKKWRKVNKKSQTKKNMVETKMKN
jgi:hypothetical protein